MSCPFDSQPSMDSSPTLNAVTSTLYTLSITLETLELSASLDEKITKMEEFTSMLSSCSNGSLSQEMSVFSMWTDATQMLSVVMVHRKRVGIMRRSMGMWSEADWKGQAERAFLSLANRGLQSSFLEVETSFLMLARDWLREHFCVTSLPSDVMPIGSIEYIQSPILTLSTYNSLRRSFQSSSHGYNKTWWDLEIVVSLARRLTTAHGPSLRDAVPRARAADG